MGIGADARGGVAGLCCSMGPRRVIMRRNAAERSYEEEGSRRRDDAESKIAHDVGCSVQLAPAHGSR
jgi:hypothetical protein